MKLAVLFSGGKDSMYAIRKAIEAGHTIEYLVTMAPKRSDSWMFHYPCIELTKLQAEAMGVKHIFHQSSGEKERELDDLEDVLMKIRPDIDGVVSGAIASRYQKFRIDSICERIGLKSLAPLWGSDPEKLLRGEISDMQVMITSVSADGLGEGWLGALLDDHTVEELKVISEKFGVNIAFEGGEAETLVLDCPIFKKKLHIGHFDKKWDPRTNSGTILAEAAHLEPKY